MALKNESTISTISGPEFINLEPLDLNPLMCSAVIKVFYLGHNRNGSYIDKETALKMAKTLRGTPIVAAWLEDKQDYGDHGHVITIEDGKVKFSCKTVPYGFVSPNASIWFQNFTEKDEFGNQIERTYLMTEGYLWAGQFEEIRKAVEESQPHSMELDKETLEGHWTTNDSGIEFFIIDDATFSKLCILGDDVEPCYEGSSIIPTFTEQKTFEHTLFTMMQELKDILQNEGGLKMTDQEKTEQNDNSDFQEKEEIVDDNSVFDEDIVNEDNTDEFANKKDKEKEEEEESEDKANDDSTGNSEDKEEEEDEDEDKKKKARAEHSLEDFEKLQAEINSLRAENEELRNFKLNIEMKEKQALVDRYFMLSDEDKMDITAHLADFSLDEIEAKLAILYVEKNVDFDKINDKTDDDSSAAISFSLDSVDSETDTEELTELQKALRDMQ